jgi:hypothetical protein
MTDRPTSLDFLQAVYLNETLPLNTRMRAAIEAAPYEHPKLSAVAVGTLTSQDFASRLDRALERSDRAKLIEGQLIEQQVQVRD